MIEITEWDIEESKVLPEELQALLPNFPNIVGMIATDWEFRENHVLAPIFPRTVEVYLDNNLSPITIIDGDISSCDLVRFLSRHKAMAVHCDGQLRYAEIKTKPYFNTLGELILPDVLVSLAAQAVMLVSLAA